MYEDILVPTDGSDGALDAVEHAIEIGGGRDARIHALYVVNRRIYVAAENGEQQSVREQLEAEGSEAIERIVEAVEAAGLDAIGKLRDGIPHREILAYSDDADIDLIVMGTHGRTGRDRLVSLGSVAERVVESADVPVMTVHIDDAESVETATAANDAAGG